MTIIETLSPIHIGSGEKYKSSEFIIKGSEIIRVDINKVYAILNEKDKDLFLEYLEDPRFRLNDLIDKMKIPVSETKFYSSNLKTSIPTEISEHIKTNTKGYIPGSSLKGAIRTAILSSFIGEKEISAIGKIFAMKNFWQRDREVERFLEGFFSTGKGQSSYSDFMRFVQISDFSPVHDLCVYNVQSLEAHGTNWRWYLKNGRTVQSYLETIAAGERLEGDINLTYNKNLHQNLVLQGNKEILHIDEIKRFIYRFSCDIIDHEISFSKKYGIDFLPKFYEDLKSKNTEKTPVIKLGHGTGYLATTIGLYLKKNPGVYEEVKKSLHGKSYSFEFPKTRKIVVEEKTPLGWCRLL